MGTDNHPWNLSKGSSSVIIGVVDTWVDLDHPDLNAKVITDRDYDFVNNDAVADDDNGHGSHVAGIAAAETNNGMGVPGTCPNCKILPVKTLNSAGSGSHYQMAAGFLWAHAMGAKVINYSGGGGASTVKKMATDYVNRNGALVIVDREGRERERYNVVYGAVLEVRDGDAVERGQKLAEWDPYNFAILTDVSGAIALAIFLSR